MLVIEIQGKRYDLPTKWEDITCDKLIECCDFVSSNMPEKLKQISFPETDEDLDKAKEIEMNEEEEFEFYDFYRKWVRFWADIPEDVSRKLSIESGNGFCGVLEMFRLTNKFLYLPAENEVEILTHVSYKQIDYYLPLPGKDVKDRSVPLNHSTFDEYAEASMINTQIKKMSKGSMESLIYIAAIFYRTKITTGNWLWQKEHIQEYHEYDVKQRAKLFKAMPMTYIWSAYFFLINQLSTSIVDSLNSLKNQTAKPAA